MNFHVTITASAENDLTRIFAYISTELCNPEAAEALLAKLETSIASLRIFPNRFPVYETENQTTAIRRLVVDNFLVFYTVDTEAALVQVIAILYAKRNIAAIIA